MAACMGGAEGRVGRTCRSEDILQTYYWGLCGHYSLILALSMKYYGYGVEQSKTAKFGT
jgi:hypothetical protein